MALASSVEYGGFVPERSKGLIDPLVYNAHKIVMERGPVLIDKKDGSTRGQWSMFEEYFKKSLFMVAGEPGSRGAVMVDPEIVSRKASSDKPTGDYYSPQGIFRETALLSANLQLFEQGKITEAELKRQYDGFVAGGHGGTEDLKRYLLSNLRMIKASGIDSRKQLEDRNQDHINTKVLIPDTSAPENTHRFVMGSWKDLQAQIATTQEVESHKHRRTIRVVSAVGAGAFLVTACSPAVIKFTSTPETDLTATTGLTQSTATKEATVVATEVPTPTRPDMSGGPYNSAEQALIENGSFKDTEAELTAWFGYWANATNNPFHPETTDIHFKYVFSLDDKSAGVGLESSAYPGICFYLPIINGEVSKLPPTATGDYTVPLGFGPLQLSDELTTEQVSVLKIDTALVGSVLGWENGNWVRIKNGQVVGTLDMASATWKAEFNVDTAKLYSVPASIEDLDANPDKYIKVADPLTDMATFKANLGKIETALGDLTKLKPNLDIVAMSSFDEHGKHEFFELKRGGSTFGKNTAFFYFEDENVKYPVYVIKPVDGNGNSYGTFAVILFDGGDANIIGDQGTSVVKDISEGKTIRIIGIWEGADSVLSDKANKMITLGLNGSGSGIQIGPGVIVSEK